jgi:hypothetical protein
MLAVFLYGTLPHEYLHDIFAGHDDTVDNIYKKGEFHISKSHTHCAFLGITFGTFLSSAKILFYFKTFIHSVIWLTALHSAFPSYSASYYNLRGPPASQPVSI